MKKKNVVVGVNVIVAAIGLLVILLTSIVIVTAQTATASGIGVFGYQTVGGGNEGANRIIGSVFSCAETGVAKSLSVAVRSSSGVALGLKGAIYRQSDLSLVAVTGEFSVPAWFEGWQTLSFSSQPSLSAGTSYVLVAFSSTVGGNFLSVYYGSSAGQGVVQGGFTYPNFPSVLSPSLNNLQCSIYCTYTSTVPTPTPSPAPLPSGESGVFGYQTVGSSNEGANRIVGSVFACSQASVATGLSVAVRSGSGVALGLKGAIYRESDLALVGVTQEVSVPAWFEGWQTLSFASELSLSAGVNYILVAFSQSVGGNFLSVYCSSGVANQGYAQGSVAYSNYPETLSPSHGSLMYSIYCTYTTSSPTPPTPPPSGESGGSIGSTNLGIYSDNMLTQSLTAVDWGAISPGSSVLRTIYVKNTGTMPIVLSLTKANWTPSSAGGLMTLTWDREGTTLAAGQAEVAILTLTVSSSISGISTFSVDIVISGTQ